MLKQVQKKIIQDVGVTETVLNLGSNTSTIMTQCMIQSGGTGNVVLFAGGASSTEACFGTTVDNAVVLPLTTYFAPVHNLTNNITIRTAIFPALTEINVVINYREFENINTAESSINLSKYSINTNTLGNTPLLANNGSIDFNIKSVYIISGTESNSIQLKLISSEFPTGIPIVPTMVDSFYYRVMTNLNQTLLPPNSSLSLSQTEGVQTSVFISYTQVKP